MEKEAFFYEQMQQKVKDIENMVEGAIDVSSHTNTVSIKWVINEHINYSIYSCTSKNVLLFDMTLFQYLVAWEPKKNAAYSCSVIYC